MGHQTKELLLDNFFEIRAMDVINEQIEARIALNAAHPVFKGHFPGNPIVPGVTMIQILKELLSIELQCDLFLSKVNNAKFTAILNPKETPAVTVKVKVKELEEKNSWKVQGTIIEGETTYFKFMGIFLKTDLR